MLADDVGCRCLSLLLLVSTVVVRALDNGVAETPPMGWLAWTRFMCQIDCDKFPDHCISEKLFTGMADVLVSEGYRDAGYDRVNVDDCWALRYRDTRGRLAVDTSRFPHGIKWLADYMHSAGLKLGVYASFGKRTCMGYPGTFTEQQMATDAQTFAEWGADMVKYDGCFTDPTLMDRAYVEFGRQLNKTGRSMVYSCSWPYYQLHFGPKFGHEQMTPDYSLIMKHCNLWRNHHDIQISWESILDIINYYDYAQESLSVFHGPGHWNDPDMIVVGNPGLTLDQCRVQMALWAIWSAPLLLSNDLRDIQPPEAKRILLNRRVIAVDQDPLGIMGKKIMQRGTIRVYAKAMMPREEGTPYSKGYSFALAFFNHGPQMAGSVFMLSDVGLKRTEGYTLHNLFTDESHGVKLPSDTIDIKVASTGVVLLKTTIVNEKMAANDGPKKPLHIAPNERLVNLQNVMQKEHITKAVSVIPTSFLNYIFVVVIAAVCLLIVTNRRLRRYRSLLFMCLLVCLAFLFMQYFMQLW